MPDVVCAQCDTEFAVEPAMRGGKAKCPQCKALVSVPRHQSVRVYDPSTRGIFIVIGVLAAAGCIAILIWVLLKATAGL